MNQSLKLAISNLKIEHNSSVEPKLRVISLGGGVQSSALYIMACENNLVDFAVFADTGWEPSDVYNHIESLKSLGNIPIVTVNNGNIRQDIEAAANGTRKFTSLPLFSISSDGKKGIIPRQCTNDYKIVPIRRWLQKICKEKFGSISNHCVELWIGISIDEYLRVKPSPVKYIRNRWPLMELGMSRDDCIEFLIHRGIYSPRSACIGCPFHSREEWIRICSDENNLRDLIKVDEMVRRIGKLKGANFLTNERVPFRYSSFLSGGTKDNRANVDDFNNECEGMCGL